MVLEGHPRITPSVGPNLADVELKNGRGSSVWPIFSPGGSCIPRNFWVRNRYPEDPGPQGAQGQDESPFSNLRGPTWSCGKNSSARVVQ